MTPTPHPPISARSGVSQLATAAVLLAYLLFTSEWRFWITVELAIVLVFSGSLLVLYASTARRLPFRKDVETWLPMLPIQLAAFLVLYGSGLAFTEQGSSMIGIFLITAGYATFSVQSILKLIKKLTH